MKYTKCIVLVLLVARCHCASMSPDASFAVQEFVSGFERDVMGLQFGQASETLLSMPCLYSASLALRVGLMRSLLCAELMLEISGSRRFAVVGNVQRATEHYRAVCLDDFSVTAQVGDSPMMTTPMPLFRGIPDAEADKGKQREFLDWRNRAHEALNGLISQFEHLKKMGGLRNTALAAHVLIDIIRLNPQRVDMQDSLGPCLRMLEFPRKLADASLDSKDSETKPHADKKPFVDKKPCVDQVPCVDQDPCVRKESYLQKDSRSGSDASPHILTEKQILLATVSLPRPLPDLKAKLALYISERSMVRAGFIQAIESELRSGFYIPALDLMSNLSALEIVASVKLRLLRTVACSSLAALIVQSLVKVKALDQTLEELTVDVQELRVNVEQAGVDSEQTREGFSPQHLRDGTAGNARDRATQNARNLATQNGRDLVPHDSRDYTASSSDITTETVSDVAGESSSDDESIEALGRRSELVEVLSDLSRQYRESCVADWYEGEINEYTIPASVMTENPTLSLFFQVGDSQSEPRSRSGSETTQQEPYGLGEISIRAELSAQAESMSPQASMPSELQAVPRELKAYALRHLVAQSQLFATPVSSQSSEESCSEWLQDVQKCSLLLSNLYVRDSVVATPISHALILVSLYRVHPSRAVRNLVCHAARTLRQVADYSPQSAETREELTWLKLSDHVEVLEKIVARLHSQEAAR